MPKTTAYLRVSTSDQDVEKNKAEILSFSNDRDFGKVIFVDETVSGTKSWKERKLKAVIDSLGKDDRLIVPELSRLGRSMLEVVEILSVSQQKGISVYSVKGNWQLDNSIQSKVMAMTFAICAEIERDLISSRTREALKARKAAGVILGRPKGPGKSKLDQFKEEIVALLNNGSTQKFIADRYHTTPANLYNWLKMREIVTKPIIKST